MSGYIYRGTNRLDDPVGEIRYGIPLCGDKRGTVAGYGRHTRRLERPCRDCREAMNAYNRKRRKKWEGNPSTREADRMKRKARARAWAALQQRHAAEYAALLQAELHRLQADRAGAADLARQDGGAR